MGSEQSGTPTGSGPKIRVDRWLFAARIFSSRTQAASACTAGHVRVNDDQVKAHRTVGPGDRLQVRAPSGLRILEVVGLSERRLSAPLARELYIDHSPPPPPSEQDAGGPRRGRSAGSPDKRDRRLLRRLRRG
jgi:ribosome-associated heat shock protein Hsp15